MSWNRFNGVSSESCWNNRTIARARIQGRKKLWVYVIVLGLFLVSCCVLMYVTSTQPTQYDDHDIEAIEIKPRFKNVKDIPHVEVVQPVAAIETNMSAKSWPERSPHPDGRWRHGEGPRSIAVTNGCLVTYPNCPDAQLILPHPSFAAPFNNISDNEIARILMVKPGDDFIDVPLPANFDEQFAKSLQFPIEVCENDTPEKVKLKQDVIEARKVLEEAANRGESPRQLLIEAAKTFRRMMEIKNTYQRLVYEQIDAGASDQEINDLVRAATQLLEKEGMESKISLPYKTRLRIENGKSKGLIKD